jgi:hypothetical protein
MPDDLAHGFSRIPPPDEPEGLPEDEGGEVSVLTDDPSIKPRLDPKTGALSIDTEDGGVVVQFNPPKPQADTGDDKFFANLADKISAEARNEIVSELLEGIAADDQSRTQWLDMRAEGIKMLGIALEKPRADAGNTTEPFEGMSTIRHPLLSEAIARFQANAAAELYPPSGPVKVRDDRPSKPSGANDIPGIGDNGGPPLDDGSPPVQATREELAEALEKGFNHNLTVVDRGYRPDSVRMLFEIGFSGCAFKKVYDCPIRERPISRFVKATDIIVADATSDARDAGRLTHRIVMRQSVVRRMQILGVYRDIELHEPFFEPNAAEQATARAQGLEDKPQRQEDQPRTIYESYVELDIEGFEHKRHGKPTGLPLPYKVTIDKDSREMLELRRNWEEDDDTFQPRTVFVKFGFIPALGFYDIGLLHLLGNGDKALTAAWREALDTGMFNNFPGFMYNEGVIRNWTNQNRIPPGGGLGIKGVPPNVPLRNVLEPLPYKDVSAGLVGITTHIEQRMDRVASMGELPVGEGVQNAPVGTTLALLDQAQKLLAAVHIGLHASQAEEFALLKERYKQNPESFWRWNKKGYAWEESLFLQALDDCEIVPAADPNTASHTLRLIKCQAVKLVAQMNPQMYDMKKVDEWVFKMIGVADSDSFFAPPPDPNAPPPAIPVDPNKQAQVQQKQDQVQTENQAKIAALQLKGQQQEQDNAAKMAEMQTGQAAEARAAQLQAQQSVVESADREADRASRERVAAMREQTEQAKLQHEATQNTMDRAHEALTAPPPGAPETP